MRCVCSGMTPSECDYHLLDTVRKCEFYGLRFYPAKVRPPRSRASASLSPFSFRLPRFAFRFPTSSFLPRVPRLLPPPEQFLHSTSYNDNDDVDDDALFLQIRSRIALMRLRL